MSYWKPIWHWCNRKSWSLTVGEFCIWFESRYYRNCGLWVQWGEDRVWCLREYTPSEAENRALDERNSLAILRRQEGDA